MVDRRLPMVDGQWSMVNRQWSIVKPVKPVKINPGC